MRAILTTFDTDLAVGVLVRLSFSASANDNSAPSAPLPPKVSLGTPQRQQR